MYTRQLAALLPTLLASACTFDTSELMASPHGDSSPPLQQEPEPAGGTPEAGAPDTGAPDTLVPDASGKPDTSAPDTLIPDTNSRSDTLIPDAGSKPDTNAPDTFVPDTSMPDTLIPDAGSKLDTSIPNTVAFLDGQATGAMTGNAWIASGSLDKVTDPTCSRPSDAGLCPATSWNSPGSLCTTGTIPKVTGGDYTDNWGIEIGVDASPTPGAPIKTPFRTITLNFAGATSPAGPRGLYLTVHRAGDPPSSNYCLDMIVSGKAYQLTSLNTACWDNSGTPFTAADAAKIDQVGLQAASDTGSAYAVTNLCLNGIVFGS